MIEKHRGPAKTGVEEAKKMVDLLQSIINALQKGTPVRNQNVSADAIRDMNFLTAKPVLFVANINESTSPDMVAVVKTVASEFKAQTVAINNKLEAEVMALPEAERHGYREALGITSSGLDELAKAGQTLLNLITFFAAGPKEVHAWHVEKGSPVTRAAGKIHSDLERGFIRAEVFNYKDIAEAGSEAALKTTGKIRMEGRDYVTQDGDVLHIHFKV